MTTNGWKDFREKNPFVAGMVAVSVAILFVVLVLAWITAPKGEFGSARTILREDYLRMAVQDFARTGDVVTARWRYQRYGDEGSGYLSLLKRDPLTDPSALLNFSQAVGDDVFVAEGAAAQAIDGLRDGGMTIIGIVAVFLLLALLFLSGVIFRLDPRVKPIADRIEALFTKGKKIGSRKSEGTTNGPNMGAVDVNYRTNPFETESVLKRDETGAPTHSNRSFTERSEPVPFHVSDDALIDTERAKEPDVQTAFSDELGSSNPETLNRQETPDSETAKDNSVPFDVATDLPAFLRNDSDLSSATAVAEEPRVTSLDIDSPGMETDCVGAGADMNPDAEPYRAEIDFGESVLSESESIQPDHTEALTDFSDNFAMKAEKMPYARYEPPMAATIPIYREGQPTDPDTEIVDKTESNRGVEVAGESEYVSSDEPMPWETDDVADRVFVNAEVSEEERNDFSNEPSMISDTVGNNAPISDKPVDSFRVVADYSDDGLPKKEQEFKSDRLDDDSSDLTSSRNAISDEDVTDDDAEGFDEVEIPDDTDELPEPINLNEADAADALIRAFGGDDGELRALGRPDDGSNVKESAGLASAANFTYTRPDVGSAATINQDLPLIHYKAVYQLGDDFFDETFSIDELDDVFIGECGLGIAETINTTDPKAVTAFEAWLFDRQDTITPTFFMLSEYAYRNPVMVERLNNKGQFDLMEVGKVFTIETYALKMAVTILEIVYGAESSEPKSYFDRVVFDVVVERK